MSTSKPKQAKQKTPHQSRLEIAKRAMRKAQREAIKEDLRYGLKPVIVEKKSRGAQ